MTGPAEGGEIVEHQRQVRAPLPRLNVVYLQPDARAAPDAAPAVAPLGCEA